jgi:hypothetical protein
MALIYLKLNIAVTANDDSKRQLKASFKQLFRICAQTMRKAISHHDARIPDKHKSVVGFILKVSAFPFLIWSKPLPLTC